MVKKVSCHIVLLSMRAAVAQKKRPVRLCLEARYQHKHGDEVSLKALGRFMCSQDSPLWSGPALSASSRASTGVPSLQRTVPSNAGSS